MNSSQIHPVTDSVETPNEALQTTDDRSTIDYSTNQRSRGYIRNFLKKFKLFCQELVSSGSWFDKFILVSIISNSVVIAFTNYDYVDDNYEIVEEGSIRNTIVAKSEIIFSIIFIFECFFKIVAQGFVLKRESYLRDNWNKFDFLIVTGSVLGSVGLDNFSVLRTVRVLRPLRSLSRFPGLRRIIRAVISVSGDLANVLVLLFFVLSCFAIIGLTYWKGLFHFRCRLTPYPIRMPTDCRYTHDSCWEVFLNNVYKNPDAFKCLDVSNDDDSWKSSFSPWYINGPQDCFWPIDNLDKRVCSVGNAGYFCPASQNEDGNIVNRTCGSNYDRFGNPRFVDSLEPFGFPRMKSGTFVEELNWGFLNYDTYVNALISTFIAITMEGWSGLMYQTIDSWSSISISIFIVLVMFGGHVVLNLVLAVISGSLDFDQEDADGIIELQENDKEISLKNLSSVTSKRQEKGSKGIVLKKMQNIVSSAYFEYFILICIFLNTVALGVDHHGISDGMVDFLEKTNLILTLIFFSEMVLCILAYGFRQYVSNPFSFFDGLIVAISVLELLITAFAPSIESSSGFSILRSFRLFRVFKMAKKWTSFQILLKTMYTTVLEIRNFAVLLFLFIYVYALIGMQLFANRLHFDATTGMPIHISANGHLNDLVPRSNFDTFVNALVTVFQVLTGENWSTCMFDGWRARGWISVVYFMSLVVFGSFLVMNLFLAILLKNFEGNDDLVASNMDGKPKVVKSSKWCRFSCSVRASSSTHPENVVGTSGDQINKRRFSLDIENPFNYILGRLLLFYVRLRLKIMELVKDPRFEQFITGIILINCLCLAFDNPLNDPQSTESKVLAIIDWIFLLLFIFEMVLKVFALGIMTYFERPWNRFDFLVVVGSILGTAQIGPGAIFRAVRTLRVIRSLRMIKRFPQLELVVNALVSAIPSVGNVIIVCFLFFFIFGVFCVQQLKGSLYECRGAIYDHLPKDQQDYLTNPFEWGKLNTTLLEWFDCSLQSCMCNGWDAGKIPTSKEVCDCLAPGDWVEILNLNFNNIANAIAILYEISSTESWVDVMYAAIDQRGIDTQPIRDNNPWWILFFVVFMIFGAFFIVQLFVGVIISQFHRIRSNSGRVLMTQAQQQWAATQQFVVRIKPAERIKRPRITIRAWCYDLVTHYLFGKVIIMLIVLSGISMCIPTFQDSQLKSEILETIDLSMAFLFSIETLLKLTAFSRRYFEDQWNIFDFFITCGTAISFIPALSNLQSVASVIRLFRIGRLFRLVKSAKSLRILFRTMIMSVPSLINVGSLLGLLFYIYAVFGVQLYSKLALNGELDDHANFRSFGNAMVSMIRFSTGENWNGFMYDMMAKTENCDPHAFEKSTKWCIKSTDYHDCTKINGCGAGSSLFLFFYSFMLIVSYVMFNLFVGVVLEAFQNSDEGDILSPQDLEIFTETWPLYASENDVYHLDANVLTKFVNELEAPMGKGNSSESTEKELDQIMIEMELSDIPVSDNGKVHILHVATHLAKYLAKKIHGEKFSELSQDHPTEMRLTLSKQKLNKSFGDYKRTEKKLRTKLKAVRVFRCFVHTISQSSETDHHISSKTDTSLLASEATNIAESIKSDEESRRRSTTLEPPAAQWISKECSQKDICLEEP